MEPNKMPVNWTSILLFLAHVIRSYAATAIPPICIGTKNIKTCDEMLSTTSPYLPLQPTCQPYVKQIATGKQNFKPCSLAIQSWDARRISPNPPFDPNTCVAGSPSCQYMADQLYNDGNCYFASTCYSKNYDTYEWVSIFQECTSHHKGLVLVNPTVGWTIHDQTGFSMCARTTNPNATNFCQVSGGTGEGFNIYWQQCNSHTRTGVNKILYNITNVHLTDPHHYADPNSLKLSMPMSGQVPGYTQPSSPYMIANFWIELACLMPSNKGAVIVQIDFEFTWNNTKTNVTHTNVPWTMTLKKDCTVVSTSPKKTLTSGNYTAQPNSFVEVRLPVGSVMNQTISDFYVSSILVTSIPEVKFVIGAGTKFLSKYGVYLSPANAKFNKSVQIAFSTTPQMATYEKNFAVISGAKLHGIDWRVETKIPKTSAAYLYTFEITDFSRQVYFIAEVPPLPYNAETKILLNDWQLVMVMIVVIVVVGTVGYMCRSRQYDVRKTEYNAITEAQKMYAAKNN